MSRSVSSIVVVLLSSLVVTHTARAQEHPAEPLLHAHAHNDYQHARPLLDALDHGFTSVETDIHLVDGELLVAHDLKDVRPARTLEALYLKPLSEFVRANSGHVYPSATEFFLLIDIKGDGQQTYAVLRELLIRYEEILTTVREDKVQAGAVTVVISGNRPRDTIASEKVRHCGIDGRLKDLKSDAPAHLMPWISDSWLTLLHWQAEGSLPAEGPQKLQEIVKQSHAAGRKVRFWATPNTKATWQILFDADVDFINADDLVGLEKFLRPLVSKIQPGS